MPCYAPSSSRVTSFKPMTPIINVTIKITFPITTGSPNNAKSTMVTPVAPNPTYTAYEVPTGRYLDALINK